MHDKDLESKCQGFNNEKFLALKNSHQGVPVVLFSRAAMYTDTRRGNSYRVYFPGKEHLTGQSFADTYAAEYTKVVCAISDNRPVYIVKPIPEMPFNIYKGLNLHKRIFQYSSDITVSLQDYERRTRVANHAIEVAAKQCNAKVIDPTPYLCPNGQCMGSRDGVPLYYDDNHLVDAGNEQLKGLFNGIIEQI